jgi:hypothetical protein
LKIIDNHLPDGEEKSEFGVCGKYLNYQQREFGIKFIEWMNALKILGNSKVHLYKKTLHPEVLDVLYYFKEQNMVEFDPFFEPSGFSWTPNYASLIQINLFTDCFYKVRNLYKFIVIFDTDELLIPTEKNVMNWHEMMERLQKDNETKPDVYNFKMINYPHFESKVREITDAIGVPKYHYMLTHTQRTKKFKTWKFFQLKSIIVPDNVQTVHQHSASRCLGRKCQSKKVEPAIAQISHYREKVRFRAENNTILDETIWKFKNQLMKAVQKTLNATQFIP